MAADHSCTADAFSDIERRVRDVIKGEHRGSESAEARQIAEVQAKIEELKAKGFLKRQEYVAANNSDFQRIFSKKS
jgi:hypothetical protein